MLNDMIAISILSDAPIFFLICRVFLIKCDSGNNKTRITSCRRQMCCMKKPYIGIILQNGNVPPDIDRAENAIRPFVIGRKNWLFSNTANGAKASAVLAELFSQSAGSISLPFNTWYSNRPTTR